MRESYVRAQTTSSLKNEIKELKKECLHQRDRLRGSRNVFRLHQQRLKDLNRTLRTYRRELHRRRFKNGKKHKK